MAARRFPGRSFRNRRSKPLRRWTADTAADDFTLVIPAAATATNNFDHTLITNDTYRQNVELEPDGATLLRVISCYTYILTAVVNLASPPTGSITWRLNWWYYIADSELTFSTQALIDARVLQWGQASGEVDLNNESPTNTRVVVPHFGGFFSQFHNKQIDTDFSCRARLKQLDQLFFGAVISILNQSGAEAEVITSHDILSRMLVGGRF